MIRVVGSMVVVAAVDSGASSDPSLAALRAATGRRGHGQDLHVLSEDGFKGLVTVDHGAKHQRLRGREGGRERFVITF